MFFLPSRRTAKKTAQKGLSTYSHRINIIYEFITLFPILLIRHSFSPLRRHRSSALQTDRGIVDIGAYTNRRGRSTTHRGTPETSDQPSHPFFIHLFILILCPRPPLHRSHPKLLKHCYSYRCTRRGRSTTREGTLPPPSFLPAYSSDPNPSSWQHCYSYPLTSDTSLQVARLKSFEDAVAPCSRRYIVL